MRTLASQETKNSAKISTLQLAPVHDEHCACGHGMLEQGYVLGTVNTSHTALGAWVTD